MPLKVTKQITVFVGLVVYGGKLLMVQRLEPECVGAHLKWEFPGGKADFGETPEKATIREIKEETGITAKIKRLLPLSYTHYWKYPWGVQQTLIFGFECEFIKQGKRKTDHHVKKIKWVPLSEVLKHDGLPGVRPFFKALNS